PGEIMVSCGGKHGLYNLFQILFDPGDEVVIPAPYWVSYVPMALLAEAVPVLIPTREANGFKLSAAELKERLSPRTKALVLNSPSNPTGSVYSRQELEELGELAPELKARTFILNGVSKTYAMTGWRIGYLAGPREGIAAATNLQSQSTSNPASISQKAAVEALMGPQEAVASMAAEFAWRRDDIHRRVLSIPGVKCTRPAGAFYLFPNFSAYYPKLQPAPGQSHSQALADYLLTEARLAAVPGNEFGED